MDTIFALASARGKAGVAVIRVSGPGAWLGVAPLVGSLPEPRKAGLRRIVCGDEVLDHALVLCFAPGQSFTGEAVVELQVHGSPAITSRLLDLLAGVEGFRLAEPGEFTRRALMNGRLDLVQVEGLADLIAAETEAQRRQAMRVFSGEVSETAAGWRANLLQASALVAAVIDFADEDVPVDVRPEVTRLVESVLSDLRRERDGFAISERVRDGFVVAILGAPNAGKSTLLNRFSGREAAIVSDRPGTTRDVIEVHMDLDGLPVTFLDTAGLRDSDDPVERLGIDRARGRAEEADLRVFLLSRENERFAEERPGDILVLGKSDLRPAAPGACLMVSGATGEGVEDLLARIGGILSEQTAQASTITRKRHQQSIISAIDALESVANLLEEGEELAAEALRSAVHDIDALIGRIDVEDLLGEIFSQFCIGK